MTRPVHYDNTILIRLSSEMKEAFYAVCKARHARKLMTDYVLNHWGVDKPKSSDTIALERCDTTLICSRDDQSPTETKPPVRPPVRPNRPKRKKGAKYIQWAS